MNMTILCQCAKWQILNYNVGENRHFDKMCEENKEKWKDQ